MPVTPSPRHAPSAKLDPDTRPQVTVQRRGTLALNPAAFRVLRSPAAVELLFEPLRRIVGLRASTTTASNAYPVRGVGKPATRYLIAGAAFTRYYGIDTDVARTWYATLQDSILCIDLNTASTVPRRDQRTAQPSNVNLA
jgi:hypothetical protein